MEGEDVMKHTESLIVLGGIVRCNGQGFCFRVECGDLERLVEIKKEFNVFLDIKGMRVRVDHAGYDAE